MIRNRKQLYIFCIALLPILLILVLPWIGSAKAQDNSLGDTSQYVYFDLAAGSVLFNGDHYRGSIYRTDASGNTTTEYVEGYISQDEGKQYYIYQSSSKNSAGWIYDEELNDYQMIIPGYDPVMINGQSWGDYITNNTDVAGVQNAWPVKAAEKFGRKSTSNCVYVVGAAGTSPTFVFDNLWSNYNKSANGEPDKCPVAFYSQPNNNITVQLKGDNRFAEVWAVSNESVQVSTSATVEKIDSLHSASAGKLIVENYPNQSGNLTLTCPIGDLANNSSIFGGDDKKKLEISSSWTVTGANTKNPNYGYSNIYINDGNVYVGIPVYNNSSWSSAKVTHGLGSRNLSYITINGGTVTAVSNSTAAAIGGGGGYNSAGGVGSVEINGGNVYAYNNSIYGANVFMPCTAIGSGSCVTKDSATGVVRINGGNVYAKSVGGLAIGGGSSGTMSGGTGYVDISGGNVTALSVPGSIAGHATDAGVAIGGGVSGTSSKNNGGNAYVNISGGTIYSGSVGGGNTRDNSGAGRNGFASVNITDGDICAQFVMEGGGSAACTFTMDGGTIHDVNVSQSSNYVYPNGGAVWMKDPKGVSTINGGAINNCTALQGGAVYMTGGTFAMTGGSINGCSAIGPNGNDGNGGAVHIMSNSGEQVSFTISGGSVSGSSATNSGGGIYLENASVNLIGGSIAQNTASINGGGICVNEGIITMYGGSVENNTATNGSGGGLYVSANNNPTLIDYLSGTISGNTAYENGGGIAIESATNQNIDFIMGINVVDDENGISYDDYDLGPGHKGHTNHISGLVHTSCPLVEGNVALNGEGGGFYLNHVVDNGGTENDLVNLQIYCLEERENIASNPESNGMFMQGGIVEIFGDASYDGEGEPACNVKIGSTILVEGGQVSVYGTMDNPHFDAPITVNIIDPENDFFKDNRFNNNEVHEYFTVSYFENFEGAGNYKQYQYEILDDVEDFIIVQNIYVHEGYQLLGWDTKPDGTGIRFEVGSGYDYMQEKDAWISDASATGDRHTLTLYAIWQEIAYFIDYVPNPPVGIPYTGEMNTQRVTILGENYLNENGFSIPKYKFMGWALSSNGSDTLYPDKYLISTPFTQVNGDVVKLYAQWEPCTHDDCEYVANDNVITQICKDCDHTATARIAADSTNYDGNEHPARIIYSDDWAGEQNLQITYTLAPNADWDDRDDIDDNFTDSTVPVHAGTYTASVVIDSDNSISCEYEIYRIEWSGAPESLDINLNSDYSVTVTGIAEDGASLEYRMAEGNSSPSDWSDNDKYEGLETGHYYIFYARNKADRDHVESASSQSQVYLHNGGNTIVFHADAGLDVSHADNIIDFTVSLMDGYHYYNYEVFALVNGGQNDSVSFTSSVLDDSSYSHSINIPSDVIDSQIDIYIKGAVKDCVVNSYITANEVFTPFEKNNAIISSDSAFTARYVVKDYSSDYTNQRFTFSSSLPVGTTLILKESNGSYWYYNVDASISEIPVGSFTRMGGIDDELTSAIMTDKNFAYQLIVDFSDVEASLRLSGDLKVSLNMTPKDSEVPSLSNTTVTATLVEVAKFVLTPSSATESDNSLSASCTYTPSTGVASIWDKRNTSLVLTATAGSSVPGDLSLTIFDGYATRTYKMNENRQFIIPLGAVASFSDLRISLASEIFTDDDIVFDVDWIVSATSSRQAPLNGYVAASAVWTFTGLNVATPSLKISDVDNPSHIYNVGSSVPVDISYLNIPDGYRIYIELYNKQKGVYTGWNSSITDFTDGSTQIMIPSDNAGNYYISVMIQSQRGGNYVNVLNPVQYYFIVK